VADTGACAHHLDVAGTHGAFGAQGVAVPQHALADVGDDLDVAVAMQRETAAHRDLVVVPDDQRAKGLVIGMAGRVDPKMKSTAQPVPV
jgi:hypothetical protein